MKGIREVRAKRNQCPNKLDAVLNSFAPRVCLIGVKPVDIDARDIQVRLPCCDPMRHQSAYTATRENADRVETRGYKVIA